MGVICRMSELFYSSIKYSTTQTWLSQWELWQGRDMSCSSWVISVQLQDVEYLKFTKRGVQILVLKVQVYKSYSSLLMKEYKSSLIKVNHHSANPDKTKIFSIQMFFSSRCKFWRIRSQTRPSPLNYWNPQRDYALDKSSYI